MEDLGDDTMATIEVYFSGGGTLKIETSRENAQRICSLYSAYLGARTQKAYKFTIGGGLDPRKEVLIDFTAVTAITST